MVYGVFRHRQFAWVRDLRRLLCANVSSHLEVRTQYFFLPSLISPLLTHLLAKLATTAVQNSPLPHLPAKPATTAVQNSPTPTSPRQTRNDCRFPLLSSPLTRQTRDHYRSKFPHSSKPATTAVQNSPTPPNMQPLPFLIPHSPLSPATTAVFHSPLPICQRRLCRGNATVQSPLAGGVGGLVPPHKKKIYRTCQRSS